MKQIFAIGVGGTGAKCIEGLVHLHACGLLSDQDGNPARLGVFLVEPQAQAQAQPQAQPQAQALVQPQALLPLLLQQPLVIKAQVLLLEASHSALAVLTV